MELANRICGFQICIFRDERMKLSTAIRLGIQKSEPVIGELIETNDALRACAEGCAGLAAIPNFQNIEGEGERYSALQNAFPELSRKIKFDGKALYLEVWVWRLNDTRRDRRLG